MPFYPQCTALALQSLKHSDMAFLLESRRQFLSLFKRRKNHFKRRYHSLDSTLHPVFNIGGTAVFTFFHTFYAWSKSGTCQAGTFNFSKERYYSWMYLFWHRRTLRTPVGTRFKCDCTYRTLSAAGHLFCPQKRTERNAFWPGNENSWPESGISGKLWKTCCCLRHICQHPLQTFPQSHRITF